MDRSFFCSRGVACGAQVFSDAVWFFAAVERLTWGDQPSCSLISRSGDYVIWIHLGLLGGKILIDRDAFTLFLQRGPRLETMRFSIRWTVARLHRLVRVVPQQVFDRVEVLRPSTSISVIKGVSARSCHRCLLNGYRLHG